jgi:hypothetical protein
MPPADNNVYLELNNFVYTVFIFMLHLLFMANDTRFPFIEVMQKNSFKVNLLSK